MSTDGTFSDLWNRSFDWFGFKTIVSHSTYQTLANVRKVTEDVSFFKEQC